MLSSRKFISFTFRLGSYELVWARMALSASGNLVGGEIPKIRMCFIHMELSIWLAPSGWGWQQSLQKLPAKLRIANHPQHNREPKRKGKMARRRRRNKKKI